MKTNNIFLKTSLLSIAIAITLGAFGAHALKNIFTDYETDIWNKAIFYQIINSLGIIIILLLYKNELIKEPKLITYLLLVGILCFSGSLYIIALTNVFIDPHHWIKTMMIPITPIGGSLLIFGWFIAAIKVKRS